MTLGMEYRRVASLSRSLTGVIAIRMALLTISLTLLSMSSVSAQEIITYSIKEESEIGQQVGTVFLDAGLDNDEKIAQIGYLVFTDDTSQAASLFSISGGRILTVGNRLDREILCSGQEDCVIHLDLQLEPQSFFRIVKVQVRILDINDNAPAFTGPVVSRSVSEAASVGFKIPLPSATDPDSPANGIDHYWINSTNGVFELDQSSSPAQFLVVKEQLDREQQDVYIIQLTATDKGSPPKSGSTILEINVIDVNDNLPKFDNETYYVIIPEDFPIGLSVISVHATDRDTGQNAEVVYGFDASTELRYGDYFDIDQNTGTITVKKALDYETMTSALLMVTATNSDGASMASFTNVHIVIGDVNDNPPEIRVRGLQPGNIVYKAETSTLDDFVAHVSVTDPDSGSNGEFDCFLSGNDFKLVKMYNTDYVIHNNIPLDREYQSEYSVVITCEDDGTRRQTTIQEVRIVISDVNDNEPVFGKSQYYVSVLENNAVGDPVIAVSAVDPDAGLNGSVVYSFLDDANGTLRIDGNTGMVTALTRLDREKMESIRIRVLAADRGIPKSLSATTTVHIDVLDEDDNAPAFSQSQYSFWIAEGQSIQSFAGRVKATDPDSEPFNRFGYFIDYDGGDSESFTIDRTSGSIYTSRVLDRELRSSYEFRVRAVSDGATPRSGTATVRIYLTDINDNKPHIRYPSPANNTVHVPNDVEVGTAVAQIEAADPDDGNNSELTYWIVSGNDGGHFSVTADGLLTVAKSLRRFEQRAFGLVIVVADGGSPSLSSETYLNIVVNVSLSASSDGLLSRHNLTIVIGIATASGVLMVVLIVAIVVLLRCPRMRSTNRKYNYVARQLDHKLNLGTEKDGITFERKPSNMTNDRESVTGQLDGSHDFSIDHTQPHKDNLYNERDNAVFAFKAITKRQKGSDSECSSASSAVETDSGRGSHEDVVLDNSQIKTQLDRSREMNEFHRQNHLPLLNPLQAELGRGTDASVNWLPSVHNGYPVHPSNDNYHTQTSASLTPYPQRGATDAFTTSRDLYTSRDQRPGYSWQSSKVSSEVRV